MSLIPIAQETSVASVLQTYEQAASAKTNLVWQQLEKISVGEALEHWLATLSAKT